MNWNDDKNKIENIADDVPNQGYSPDPVLDAPSTEPTPVDSPTENLIAESPSEIVVPEGEVDTISPDQAPRPPARIARALQVVDDTVTNVILIAVDEDDAPVGFETPYGEELVIVEDDSIVTPGWVRIDGEFVDPNAE